MKKVLTFKLKLISHSNLKKNFTTNFLKNFNNLKTIKNMNLNNNISNFSFCEKSKKENSSSNTKSNLEQDDSKKQQEAKTEETAQENDGDERKEDSTGKYRFIYFFYKKRILKIVENLDFFSEKHLDSLFLCHF